MNNGRLILNADDFGMSAEHNSAILAAHTAGAITSASLMMGEAGTAEAVAIAHSVKTLPVGLHLALSDATPVLPPHLIPRLVRGDGRFYRNEIALVLAAASSEGRKQIQLEASAQFKAFHESGLSFDHVNVHRHGHLLPHVAVLVFEEAKKWGVKKTRLPWDGLRPPRIGDAARQMRFHILRWMIKRCGITTITLALSRDWNATVLLDVLQNLPDGLIELSFHPVALAEHRYASDLPALTDKRVLSFLALQRSCSPDIPETANAVVWPSTGREINAGNCFGGASNHVLQRVGSTIGTSDGCAGRLENNL